MILLEDGRTDALANPNLFLYLVPIFTDFLMHRRSVRALVGKIDGEVRALKPVQSWHMDSYRESQEYDKLAGLVRSSLDMDKIYEIVEKGV